MNREMYRSSAPQTSVDAAEGINITPLEEKIHSAIKTFGNEGCISDEVQAMFPQLAYSSVTARFAALIRKGHIYVLDGDVRPGLSGRNQRVMRASASLYPTWICPDCGDRLGRRECGIATFHMDHCDVCGAWTLVTEPRDFGHLKKGWEDEAKEIQKAQPDSQGSDAAEVSAPRSP